MNGGIKGVLGLLVSVALIIFLLLVGCVSNPGGENLPSPANSDNQQLSLTNNSTSENKTSGIPPFKLPPKGNPKLDTALNRLIEAEKQGQAESFAQQHIYGGLADGKVRVQIECFPGGLEAAVKSTAAVGTVYSIAPIINYIGAVVPITSLTALANEESIRIIRSPLGPELQGSQPR